MVILFCLPATFKSRSDTAYWWGWRPEQRRQGWKTPGEASESWGSWWSQRRGRCLQWSSCSSCSWVFFKPNEELCSVPSWWAWQLMFIFPHCLFLLCFWLVIHFFKVGNIPKFDPTTIKPSKLELRKEIIIVFSPFYTTKLSKVKWG